MFGALAILVKYNLQLNLFDRANVMLFFSSSLKVSKTVSEMGILLVIYHSGVVHFFLCFVISKLLFLAILIPLLLLIKKIYNFSLSHWATFLVLLFFNIHFSHIKMCWSIHMKGIEFSGRYTVKISSFYSISPLRELI